jgi:hypothetical protein
MIPTASTVNLSQAGPLLRGESEEIARWLERWETRRLGYCLAAIFVGASLFGGALGAWRSPLQALYGGIKFPLVILLTTAGTALLNGMLAPLLGLNLKLRQSLLIILFSHTIAALILGGFSPILLFAVWNVPPVQASLSASWSCHSAVLVIEVGLIAFAGILANVRLRQLLDHLSGKLAVSRRLLLAWLAANLFLGAQISWLLRPFVGSPELPVEFLRHDAFQGNFYEAVFHALKNLLNSINT